MRHWIRYFFSNDKRLAYRSTYDVDKKTRKLTMVKHHNATITQILCKKKYKCDKHIKHFSGIPGILYNCTILYSFIQKKMKFSIKDFFSKCDQIRSFLRIWSHLLKKFLRKTTFFVKYSNWQSKS